MTSRKREEQNQYQAIVNNYKWLCTVFSQTIHEERIMDINSKDTALLVTDPQNDFLSEQGVTWELVGDSVKANGTIGNIERLFKAAKEGGYEVFISPHYYYPTDHGWHFGGTIEKVMHEINMFDRKGALTLEGFAGSGADWLDRYKPYIEDGKTIIANPHKVYGPENNDLSLQLRKRGIDKVILAGMSANLCVEAHLREMLEQGFEVAVIKDATAGARHPELGDGYEAAIVNYGYIANAVMTTDEAVEAMGQAVSAAA
jgi:nicotinamidase-related amidase